MSKMFACFNVTKLQIASRSPTSDALASGKDVGEHFAYHRCHFALYRNLAVGQWADIWAFPPQTVPGSIPVDSGQTPSLVLCDQSSGALSRGGSRRDSRPKPPGHPWDGETGGSARLSRSDWHLRSSSLIVRAAATIYVSIKRGKTNSWRNLGRWRASLFLWAVEQSNPGSVWAGAGS